MANGTAHTVFGGFCGLAAVMVEQNESKPPINALLAVGTSAIFAKLPDVLEPAINPHHRQFFHSVLVLAAIGYGIKKAYEWVPQNHAEELCRALALCAGVGYVSHLLLDGLTPRSLPLVGKM